MHSPWVTRAVANELPMQGFRGDVTRPAYVNDGFDDDLPLGENTPATVPAERVTMKREKPVQPKVTVTYERGMPILWNDRDAL
jgi:hypothetical protein